MKLITSLYQLCGFDFVEESFLTIFRIPTKFSVLLVLLLHLIYISFNLKYQYDLHVALFKHPDIVGTTTNLVEMLAPLVCHFTIIIESLCKRNKEAKIKNAIRNLRKKLNLKSTDFPLVAFLFLLVVNSFIWIIAFITAYHDYGRYQRYITVFLNSFCLITKPYLCF